MNINDLPLELLQYIFSYLPQRDFFHSVRGVCLLWNQVSGSPSLRQTVNFEAIRETYIQPFQFVIGLQNYIKELKIHAEQLEILIRYYADTRFMYMTSLLVTHRLTWSEFVFSEVVSRCPNLKAIKITPDKWNDLQRCLKKLSELSLMDADIGYFEEDIGRIHNDIIPFIVNQKCLKRLSVRAWYTLRNDTLEEILNKCPTLTSLFLSGCYTSSPTFLSSTKPLGLTDLSIHSSSNFQNEDLEIITKRSKNLKTLNIEICRKITEQGFFHIANHCPLLENLFVGNLYTADVPDISSSCLAKIARGCPRLQTFSAISCEKIDDIGIISLATSCINLTSLVLARCNKITDESLFAIAEHCPLLRDVDFKHCYNITIRGVLSLILSCKRLEKLNISSCTGIAYTCTEATFSKDNNLDFKKVQDISSSDVFQNEKSKELPLSQVHYELNISSTEVVNYHSHLKELDVRWCKHVSKNLILKFTELCPDLVVLKLSKSTDICEDKNWIKKIFKKCNCLSDIVVGPKTTIYRSQCM